MMRAAELFDLRGRTALVTGATGGIGGTIAETLALNGAHVLLGTRRAEAVAPLIARLAGQGATASPWLADLSDAAERDAAIAGLEGRSVDILVNCAGAITRGRLGETTEHAWNGVLDLNLTVPWLLSRAVAPGMRARGWGRIVNVGSVLSLQGKANAASYAASKHGLAGLTRALAAELAPDICVNALCPGYVRTALNQSLQDDPNTAEAIASLTPARRWAEPRDLAGSALFLSSNAAAFVNGHLLVVDGGMTATHRS